MAKVAYFDNASTTFPKPQEVYDRMIADYKEFGVSPGRGQYSLAGKSSEVMMETRELLLKYLKAPQYIDTVIWTKSATEALNMCIRSLIPDRLYAQEDCTGWSNWSTTGFEHNAITRLLTLLGGQISGDFGHTDVKIVPFNSNVTGEILEIETKVDILDCAASVGYYDIDFSKSRFTIISGHKGLYSPTGIAAIVCSSSDAKQLKPLVYGGTGVDSKEQDLTKVDLPDRLEAGTADILAILGLRAALKWHIKNEDKIRATTIMNYEKLIAILSDYENIKIIEPYGYPIVSCLFDKYSPDEIGRILDKKNVAVRTGLHCSPGTHKKIGTYPSGTVRFSCSYFNSDEDFVILKSALNYIREAG